MCCFYMAPFSLGGTRSSFQCVTSFARWHMLVHWWRRLPCTAPTGSSAAIRGFIVLLENTWTPSLEELEIEQVARQSLYLLSHTDPNNNQKLIITTLMNVGFITGRLFCSSISHHFNYSTASSSPMAQPRHALAYLAEKSSGIHNNAS